MTTLTAGYKQTEIGVIPEDWEIKPIKQFADTVRGGSPRPAGDSRYFNGSYIPWLTVASLTNIPSSQLILKETATHLTEEGSRHSRTLLAGTLIIANSGATLGVSKILGIKCCANDGIAALLNVDKNIDIQYIAHFLNTKTMYLREVVATGNGQPNLNTDLIGNFSIPLPPTKTEQQLIATALSDTDALIESLEKLIAKKRQIKQGAMQELLSPKEGWEVKYLEDIATFKNGKAHENNISDSGKYIVVNSKFISTDGEVKKYSNDNFLPAFKGDVLMVMSDVPNGKAIAKCFVVDRDNAYTVNQRICVISPLNIDGKFLFYKLNRHPYYLSFDDGVKQTNLRKNDVLSCSLDIPSTKAEQTTIATILSDMDAEITALEERLEKTRTLKSGMMHELLTGRIRLI